MNQPTENVLGWREWGALPDLGIPAIKMKVDTGARTSALHAFKVRRVEKRGEPWVRFSIHPVQRDVERMIECAAPIHDERFVTDSGGHKEKRIVILTPLTLGEITMPVELTLTRRDTMLFRMLLGRQAIRSTFLVNPGKSFLLGRELANTYKSPQTTAER